MPPEDTEHNFFALSPGTMLGHYKLLRSLGQGGFGITYLAEDTQKRAQVVIKENLPQSFSFRHQGTHRVCPISSDTTESFNWAKKRFLDEARTLARLKHPQIVRVLAAFEALGTAYYVMPWVGGQELHKAAPAPADITEEWLLPILRHLLEALDYLHGKNLLHRDIKPANILLREDGTPILIDFDNAREIGDEHSDTIVVIPGYTPVEQLHIHGKLGPWSDIYSLGATCYCLLTGERPPYVIDRLDDDPLPELATNCALRSRFSHTFLTAIDRALLMSHNKRWQSAAEWLTTLCNSAILTAAKEGKAEQLSFLLTARTDVNITDDEGITPLYWAAWSGHADCVRLLLAAPGINVNAADKNGETPLSIATRNGHKKCTELLRAAGGTDPKKEEACAKLRTQGFSPANYGSTLLTAAQEGKADLLTLLLTAGANVNTTDKAGRCPLYEAAY